MFRIAICDDCLHETEIILSLLGEYQANRPDICIYKKSFDSGSELLKDLENGQQYDMFLLDILMPEQSGIDVAQNIRAADANVPILFLTSSADYALDAFSVFATSYILKPICKDTLFIVLDKVMTTFKQEESRYFLLSTLKRTVKVSFASIVCIELFNRTLRLYHENGEVIVSTTVRTPFAVIIAPLLEDDRFLCAHKSYVLNMAHVEVLTAHSFVMKHSIEVPIPRYRYTESKAKYFAWISKFGNNVIGGRK